MRSEEMKDNGKKGKHTAYGCCNQEDFRKMFEHNCNYFFGQSNAADFSAMNEGMMKKMMDGCCGQRAQKTETNIKSQKRS